MNVAPTVVSPLTVNEHVLLVPLHGPDQPPNVEPESGVSVSVTAVPLATATAHIVPHEIPAALVTVPEPDPARLTVTRYVFGALNVAVPDRLLVIVTVHVLPLPEQMPDQAANVEPESGTSVNVMLAPAGKDPLHVPAPQLNPG